MNQKENIKKILFEIENSIAEIIDKKSSIENDLEDLKKAIEDLKTEKLSDYIADIRKWIEQK